MIFTKESKERPECSLLKYIVSAMRTVTSNITKGPNCLFPDIENR